MSRSRFAQGHRMLPLEVQEDPRPDVQVRLPNTHIADVKHNHDDHGARIAYVGFSEKAPGYHLFKCRAQSAAPRRTIQLIPFNPQAFTPESKAGRGGCSMPECREDAAEMEMGAARAYCKACARQRTNVLPCPWTQIEPCREKMGLTGPPYGKPCPVCITEYQEEE